jgi:phosphoribosyl-ATP pyrophosphohydrolase/phosphoribosyl-AMP cyclohydrolase/histidinol dehydrogenase
MSILPLRSTDDRPQFRDPIDPDTLIQVMKIIEDVRQEGEQAVRAHAERLGDIQAGDPMVIPPEALAAALAEMNPRERGVLQRTAERIERFALAQRASAEDTTVPLPGGRGGDRLVAVDVAGCYAPGGRYPLPSSVLMTAVTAKAAGVRTVWVASPKPTQTTLAAASIAGADGVLSVGGAQGIAALAYGFGEVPSCDVIVGPGNRWVTAAKYVVSATVGVDLIAGPSELVVVATSESDAELVAADLLAQAEHDPDALPILVVLAEDGPGQDFLVRAREEIGRQLEDLPTADTARLSLRGGYALVTSDEERLIAEVEGIAPEHLQLHAGAESLANRFSRYGGLFVGEETAEVLGDYGAGPNHTLPTGGTARYTGGLSVFTFLRRPTWMELSASQEGWKSLSQDSVDLARMEGLEAHARAAEKRIRRRGPPLPAPREGGLL